MARISKRSVDALQPSHKEVWLWDDQIRGFGVRVQPGGTKTFVYQYRQEGRSTRRYKLGVYGSL